MSLVYWSRLWSPVVPQDLVTDAWAVLGLPGEWQQMETEFISTFHQGMPAPTISLLLHASLNIPGDRAREDWMRIINWLNLEWGDARLPPDHLAIACEVTQVAVALEEAVLVEEIKSRYLLPWCDRAAAILDPGKTSLSVLPDLFRASLTS